MVQSIIRSNVKPAIDAAIANLDLTAGGIGAATPQGVQAAIANLSLPFAKEYEFHFPTGSYWSQTINLQGDIYAGYVLQVKGGGHIGGRGFGNFDFEFWISRNTEINHQISPKKQQVYGNATIGIISVTPVPNGINIKVTDQTLQL